jgi:signal transduction histidine kinase
MSSAVLKFQKATPEPKDLGILAAAVEVLPHPFAITENETLIYQNQSFAQLMSNSPAGKEWPVPTAADWQTMEFSFSGRKFSLIAHDRAADLGKSDLHHLVMIGRLVGGVAHDFNNLLTGILLYCDLLQSRVEATGALWKKTDEIRRAAEQGAALIRQLMTVGREEKGEHSVSCFSQVVREIEPLLRHLLGEQIRIEFDLSDHSANVGISAAQAQQIILNLALNARDAMSRGGMLKFQSCLREFEGTGPAGHIFEFVVSDTGDGMDDQTAARAFDPFFSTKASGHGTGLATVRSIVETAGGAICAETSPGRGTSMIVRLPEVRDHLNTTATDQAGRSIPEHSRVRGETE